MEINLKSKIYNLKSPFAYLLILTILFFIINGALLMKLGIMTDADTAEYLTYASEIKEKGIFYKEHYFWYLGYSLFILAMQSIHDSKEAIVFGQYILSYLALLCLYTTGKRLFHNPMAGLIAGIWFLGFLMIPFWNLFLYAESLLISLNCIAFYFLIKWHQGEAKPTNIILGTIVIIAAILTKPNAISLLAAILAAGLYKLYNSTKSGKLSSLILPCPPRREPSSFNNPSSFRPLPLSSPLRAPFFNLKSKPQFGKFAKLVVPLTFLLFSLTFLILLNQMLSTFGFERDYQIGEIVYNVHTVADQPYAKWLMIKVPENLYLPNPEAPPLWKLTTIIVMNPWYSLKLFTIKAFYYIFYIRPYFSWSHNIIALAVLLPMYYFTVRQLIAKNLEPIIKYFVITFLVVAILSVSLLTINWNSRFLVPILPLIFLIGAGGIAEKKILDVR